MAGRIVQGRPIAGSTGTVASSSAGGPVSVVLSIGSTTGNKHWHIHQLLWSQDAAPSSQTITVYEGTSSGSVVLQFQPGSSGHDTMFLSPLRTIANTDATIVFSSASTGYQYLNVFAFEDD